MGQIGKQFWVVTVSSLTTYFSVAMAEGSEDGPLASGSEFDVSDSLSLKKKRVCTNTLTIFLDLSIFSQILPPFHF